jgi:hypothetical protein
MVEDTELPSPSRWLPQKYTHVTGQIQISFHAMVSEISDQAAEK